MLVLGRKEGESIRIGHDIRVVIVKFNGGGVRVGVEAPSEVKVHREEVYEAIQRGDECQQ